MYTTAQKFCLCFLKQRFALLQFFVNVETLNFIKTIVVSGSQHLGEVVLVVNILQKQPQFF